MESSVGSYEAKTHLPQLLERVSHGERITITRRGVPIARLVPVTERTEEERARIDKAVAELLAIRKQNPALGDLNIKELINEGRRF